jgi:hypothetical protein
LKVGAAMGERPLTREPGVGVAGCPLPGAAAGKPRSRAGRGRVTSRGAAGTGGRVPWRGPADGQGAVGMDGDGDGDGHGCCAGHGHAYVYGYAYACGMTG